MTHAELEVFGRNVGEPVMSTRAYKKDTRYFGLIEYSDPEAAEKCIAKLDGKRVHGSDFRLRVVSGQLHEEFLNQQLRDATDGREKRAGSRSRGAQPKTKGYSGEVRPGDWECPSCRLNVFASKTSCFKCGYIRDTPRWETGASGGSGGSSFSGAGDDNDNIMTLYAVDLPVDASEDEVRIELEKCCGRKALLRVMLVKRNGLSSAFIRFSAPKFAKRAREDIEDGDIKVRGQRIRADMARRNTDVS